LPVFAAAATVATVFAGGFAAAAALVPSVFAAVAAVVLGVVLVPVVMLPCGGGGGGPAAVPPVVVPIVAPIVPTAGSPPGRFELVFVTDAMVKSSKCNKLTLCWTQSKARPKMRLNGLGKGLVSWVDGWQCLRISDPEMPLATVLHMVEHLLSCEDTHIHFWLTGRLTIGNTKLVKSKVLSGGPKCHLGLLLTALMLLSTTHATIVYHIQFFSFCQ